MRNRAETNVVSEQENMMNKLDQLKKYTMVVADTGDIDAIGEFCPEDATTNPSLILKAAQMPQYDRLVNQAVHWAKTQSHVRQQQVIDASDKLAVNIGLEILKIIPGRISTEVDARLSFDSQASIDKAHKLIELYHQAGINRQRILIKLAATWEGIRAAEILEKQGINCNLTLLFNFAQAKACAEAGVWLISPFVGRILDWHIHHGDKKTYMAHEDPGVLSVRQIYDYYKDHGYSTIVMGASFRNPEEVLALAGCDRLTISPTILQQLMQQQGEISRELCAERQHIKPQPPAMTQAQFRWEMNQDTMACDKLAEGIRGFAADQQKLAAMLHARLG